MPDLLGSWETSLGLSGEGTIEERLIIVKDSMKSNGGECIEWWEGIGNSLDGDFTIDVSTTDISDNLTITVLGNIELKDERLEIPDYALDMHTYRGRKMGRRIGHFFTEGAKLENQAMEDPYEQIAFEILKKKRKT